MAAGAMVDTAARAFNARLSDMLADLRAAYPDVSEFRIAEELHAAAVFLTPALPVRQFAAAVEPYRDRIAQRDEEFLLSQDYCEVDEGVVGALKRVWAGMRPDDRSCVFDHLIGLLEVAPGRRA